MTLVTDLRRLRPPVAQCRTRRRARLCRLLLRRARRSIRPPFLLPARRCRQPWAHTRSSASSADRLSPTIYAYTDSGWLYRSDLNGRSWYLVITEPAVADFLMSPSDPNVLYSGKGPDCGGSSVSIAPMHKSEDGGETWTELPAGLDLKPLLIDPSNPNNVFAADCATIYLYRWRPDVGA